MWHKLVDIAQDIKKVFGREQPEEARVYGMRLPMYDTINNYECQTVEDARMLIQNWWQRKTANSILILTA